MQQHVKILAIIMIVFGCLGVMAAVALAAVMSVGGSLIGSTLQNDKDFVAFLAIGTLVGTLLFVLFIVCTLPGILAGWGLLHYKPWARILTIVLSALNILNAPIGTVLGIYGLWVMLNAETEQLFRGAPPLSPPPPAYPTQTV